MGILASTKGVQAAGLVVATTPVRINSVTITNYSGSAAYAILSDSSTAMTDLTKIIGIPKLVPAGAQVILGSDLFGGVGQGTNTGLTVDMSTTSTSFTTAGAHFDIEVTAP